MSFKNISIFSSGSPFVHWSVRVCAILVENIMEMINVKLF